MAGLFDWFYNNYFKLLILVSDGKKMCQNNEKINTSEINFIEAIDKINLLINRSVINGSAMVVIFFWILKTGLLSVLPASAVGFFIK